MQARRRLGLTAALVREDGREDDVFALIGPKKVDIPWKEMEAEGWIAKARCTEIRLPLTETRRFEYAVAQPRHQFRVASENPEKLKVVRRLLERHADTPTLIIGMYVEQIENLAHFYSLVSRDTVEQQFAMKRQLFLCEQGYQYAIWNLASAETELPQERI